jgi:hypothetical protein
LIGGDDKTAPQSPYPTASLRAKIMCVIAARFPIRLHNLFVEDEAASLHPPHSTFADPEAFAMVDGRRQPLRSTEIEEQGPDRLHRSVDTACDPRQFGLGGVAGPGMIGEDHPAGRRPDARCSAAGQKWALRVTP